MGFILSSEARHFVEPDQALAIQRRMDKRSAFGEFMPRVGQALAFMRAIISSMLALRSALMVCMCGRSPIIFR